MTSNRKETLKAECLNLKASFSGVRVAKTSEYSLVHVRIDAPVSCTIDIPFILIEFCFSGLEAGSKRVRLTEEQLPNTLNMAIATKIDEEWQKNCKKSPAGNWCILETCEWIQKNYINVVSCLPGSLESYMGEGMNGESVRRWAVLETVEDGNNDETVEDGNDDGNESEDSDQQSEEAKAYWRRMKAEEEQERQRQKAAEAEERRLEIERDPTMHATTRKLSIKEQQELKEAKNKQGVRLRKTGAKRKKYQGEGAAAAK